MRSWSGKNVVIPDLGRLSKLELAKLRDQINFLLGEEEIQFDGLLEILELPPAAITQRFPGWRNLREEMNQLVIFSKQILPNCNRIQRMGFLLGVLRTGIQWLESTRQIGNRRGIQRASFICRSFWRIIHAEFPGYSPTLLQDVIKRRF